MDPAASWNRTPGVPVPGNASQAREGNVQTVPSVPSGNPAVSTPPAMQRNGAFPSSVVKRETRPPAVSSFQGSPDQAKPGEQPWFARPANNQFSAQHSSSTSSYPPSSYPPSSYPPPSYPPSSYPPSSYPPSSYPASSAANRSTPGQAAEAAVQRAEETHAGKSLKEHQEFLLQKQLQAERQRETGEKERGFGATQPPTIQEGWREKPSGPPGLSFYTQSAQGQHPHRPGLAPPDGASGSHAGAFPHPVAVPGPAFVPSHGSAPSAAVSSLSSLGLSGCMTGSPDAREPPSFLGRLFSFGSSSSGAREQRVQLQTGCSAGTERDGSDEIGDEPPLLEELGIHPDEVVQRFKSVVFFYKVEHDLLVHSDMCGPLVVAVTLAFLLLMSGKASFSHIYGLSIVGSLCTYVLLNLMSPNEGIDLYSTISILGYSLLPVVLFALASIFISLKTSVGLIFSVLCVLWCTATASRFFESALHMHDQRFLVAYPISLFYASFVVIAVL
ncbi:Similarity to HYPOTHETICAL INTEGRAL MEMBRANE PROTEIN YIPA_yeast, related [Neospora caninum Liverpool]|uniref:Similarity to HYPOTHETICAL INTEGRAL MEMBRANE PROTEIN YIPA_yeast, related n=1 Tax=Neospora caninum (strain Liverpool) TaxID=572307 RepID=F0VKV8_NEOCL|nr:Similarity to HYPOTHETICAL INTEGRAL MEMBRANE PROTEIN YIPA_yeast, related [Neospora caninum Liverpool]CBZ54709.1 Similarity to HYPOTHETICAL INTEGRAL MEMBRANE PROTEIN YIPA_yeast, related [Neospora caninum Liverpool]CEL69425.1 TPA: Similarity to HYPOTHETICAL INTEGRAL MEMBRANE PROTEIN YIPA_yeast, related [Neospora caninum Liverpool]|eukprot:XP_003884739.1 Similarity to HYPOTHETICAL INTEGRAL MEMBRANE PROTEIN YIPA_yeast, related [Neospora caninum Liverpool]